MKRDYLLFFCFLGAVILIAGFNFFSQNPSADTTSAVIFTVKISVCGNGEKEYGEDCDDEDFDSDTCQTLGFGGGTLNCSDACEFDTDACSAATPAPTATATPPPSGGGGGIISTPTPIIITQVIFKGKAYPKSDVTLLKDAQVAATTKVGPDANFETSLSGLTGGTYTFGVWAEDAIGNKSITHNFTISIASGAATVISGIFLPPSISIDKTEVKMGEVLNIMGYSAPQAEVAVIINSDNEILKKTTSQANGAWFYKFDTLEADYGDHTVKSRSTKDSDISTFSKIVAFKIGNKTIPAEITKKTVKGNLNDDGKVNLIDFSIMAYWYNRPTPPMKIDLNSDGKVNLIDFSIMAYYWTG